MTEQLLTQILQTSWIEWLAVITGIAYTVLAAYENNWCWLSAIISVLLYIYICFNAKLYSETGLQFFYLIMAFYGWWQWKNNKATKSKENNTEVLDTPAISDIGIAISKLSLKQNLHFLAIGALFTSILYFIMSTFTDAALPLPDAFVTAYSIVATYMMTKKYIENWLWWIVIDGAAIFIYINRGLKLTAVLFFIYVIIVVLAYFKWRKELLQQNA